VVKHEELLRTPNGAVIGPGVTLSWFETRRAPSPGTIPKAAFGSPIYGQGIRRPSWLCSNGAEAYGGRHTGRWHGDV